MRQAGSTGAQGMDASRFFSASLTVQEAAAGWLVPSLHGPSAPDPDGPEQRRVVDPGRTTAVGSVGRPQRRIVPRSCPGSEFAPSVGMSVPSSLEREVHQRARDRCEYCRSSALPHRSGIPKNAALLQGLNRSGGSSCTKPGTSVTHPFGLDPKHEIPRIAPRFSQ